MKEQSSIVIYVGKAKNLYNRVNSYFVGKQNNKTAKELGAREPIVPPLALQQVFAKKIEAIEKQKELIKESIKESETLFNARMDYYFN